MNPGQSTTLAICGDGIIGGMTTFEVSNPEVRRVSDFSYAGNYVYATFNVAPDATPTSLVIFAKSGNETAAMTGALRITGRTRTRVAHR